MGRKRAMSLIRVYLLAKTFVFRNEHIQLVFKLKTILLKIRTLVSLKDLQIRAQIRALEGKTFLDNSCQIEWRIEEGPGEFVFVLSIQGVYLIFMYTQIQSHMEQ
jgi:hypothetical protein